MKKLFWLIPLLWSFPALAQNPTCPTRPIGDSSNACASTAFVGQNRAAAVNIWAPPITIPNVTIWNVTDAYGNIVNTTGTTTFGLQEAINTAFPPFPNGCCDAGRNIEQSSVWSAGVVTVTTVTPHGYPIGNVVPITIFATPPNPYTGTFNTTIINTTQFTYPQPINPGPETSPGSFILPVDTQRALYIGGGYIGSVTIDIPGHQNGVIRADGTNFLILTERSCEMCVHDFNAAQTYWTFIPNDRGTGVDNLCQIVDSRYFGTTVFWVIMDTTQTNAECPVSAITNSTFEIVELNVSTNSLVCGWKMFSPRGGQNVGKLRVKTSHTHKDAHTGPSTYFCIGDQAPAGGQTFGYSVWDLNIDNSAGIGTERAFDTYASNDFIKLRVVGFTSGPTLFFQPGACNNVAQIETDQAVGSVVVTDNGACAAGTENSWTINGVPFQGGSRGIGCSGAPTAGFTSKNGIVTTC